jgi:hypothetical protein
MTIFLPVGATNALSMTLENATALASEAQGLLQVIRFDNISIHEQSQGLRSFLRDHEIPSDHHRKVTVDLAVGLSLNWFVPVPAKQIIDSWGLEKLVKELPRPVSELCLSELDREITRLSDRLPEYADRVVQSKDRSAYRLFEDDCQRLADAMLAKRLKMIDQYRDHIGDWSYADKQIFREDQAIEARRHEGIRAKIEALRDKAYQAMGGGASKPSPAEDRANERVAEVVLHRIGATRMYARELGAERDPGRQSVMKERLRVAENGFAEIKNQLRLNSQAKASVLRILQRDLEAVVRRVKAYVEESRTKSLPYHDYIHLNEEQAQLEDALRRLTTEV